MENAVPIPEIWVNIPDPSLNYFYWNNYYCIGCYKVNRAAIFMTMRRKYEIEVPILRTPNHSILWHLFFALKLLCFYTLSFFQEYVEKAKKRRVSMKSTEEFWSKRQHTDSSAMESWILSRQNDLVMGKGFFFDIYIIFLISETTRCPNGIFRWRNCSL